MDSNILHNWKKIQRCIFPTFEEEYGPQTPAHERIIVILDYLDLARFIPQPGRINGRPPHDRVALANEDRKNYSTFQYSNYAAFYPYP
ncbi:MAG: hypothetical protein KA436_05140 [Oligoflexales bacterium]|nr:hypothetical protein [Oligoflexales bacterium]